MTLILQSTLTCPNCGTEAVETMPTDACLYFYDCTGCGSQLKPKRGDCCVFCSYGSVPCPPIQSDRENACCSAKPEGVVPEVCSLQPGAFRERLGEIGALIQAFDGVAKRTPDGLELRFTARQGLRAALDSLAEKERSCCATLAFTVREEAGSISLLVSGSGDDRKSIDDLAARLGAPSAEYQLRPNVPRPDWSKITLPKAREVLQRWLAAGSGHVTGWARLDRDEDNALMAILRHFADHGRAPSTEAVAAASGLSLGAVQRALGTLRTRDLIVLDQAGIAILAAYPFAGYSTGHRVTLRDRTVDSLCAIDALGSGAMCETATTIDSACRHCGTPINIATGSGGTALAAVEPATTVVWYTLTFDGCVAQTRCPNTSFFCNDDHLAAWRAGQGQHSAGERLAVDEALEIGVALFAPLLRSV